MDSRFEMCFAVENDDDNNELPINSTNWNKTKIDEVMRRFEFALRNELYVMAGDKGAAASFVKTAIAGMIKDAYKEDVCKFVDPDKISLETARAAANMKPTPRKIVHGFDYEIGDFTEVW